MSTNFKADEWVSQSEAARIRGVSRQAISKLVKNERLETVAIGGRELVKLQDVLQFVPLKAGRHRGKNEH